MLDTIRDTFTPTSTREPDEPEIDAAISDIAHTLRNDRRRRTIQHLTTHGETTLKQLATKIARLETDGTIASQDRKTVYVTLYQNHLPTLEEAGVLQWDKDRGDITPTSEIDGYARAIRCLEDVAGGDTR